MRPPEAETLLAAARTLLRERGLAGVTVAAVLERTELGTRAFYRHFASKDQLLVEVFADATRTEVARLQSLMAVTVGPVGAVAAWVDGRLALAFDPSVETDLKHLSEQATALYDVAPAMMADLCAAMMRPLIEQVTEGIDSGAFAETDPVLAAQAVADVAWACVQRAWMLPTADPHTVREQTKALCLRALGAAI
ncbi:MAG TPA: helix-turn-helix domain-containing protein [Marmoricola sp.]|jgi:AcrR family transcriptional regulator|nr:helix-turn-helix domain-containing protein [Marmoricola sp.]